MQPKSICALAVASVLTSCAGLSGGANGGHLGAPPMPTGFYGHQQPNVANYNGPDRSAQAQSGQPFAVGAQAGYPQQAYAQNQQGQWVPTGAPQNGYGQVAQGQFAPNQGQANGSWNTNQAMPGSMLANGQPTQPVGWSSAPGAPMQAPAAPTGWGQPGMGAAVPGAHPEANQGWPHGTASQGAPALDPWAAKAPQGGSSTLVLPQAAAAAGEAIGDAVGGIADLVTGARSVPPGSTGLESRGVYDADGGAAKAQLPGAVGELDGQMRELELSGSGRLYLLEMYQQALEDRDTLEMEVGTLTARLEHMQARATELETQLAATDAARAKLAQDGETLRAENQDLAARLVTAQIRRLEAEKMLIEARIEQERSAAPAEGTAQTAAPRGTGAGSPAGAIAAPGTPGAAPSTTTAVPPATSASSGNAAGGAPLQR
ncbi:MAG: hypothetical protein GC161_02125 [Planctomycetaceae bacterium]|nr:hypothetical protein [Planctomycetaceae bacterium]